MFALFNTDEKTQNQITENLIAEIRANADKIKRAAELNEATSEGLRLAAAKHRARKGPLTGGGPEISGKSRAKRRARP